MTNDEVVMSGSPPSNSSRPHRVLGSNFLQETTMIKAANAENINTLSSNQWLTRPKRGRGEESEATRKGAAH